MKRQHDSNHLQFIRTLPCVGCMVKGKVTAWSESAHLRIGSLEHDKRQTGMAEKPDDQWALPLCTKCHRTGNDSQHAGGEQAYWDRMGVNPFELALALHGATGDKIKANAILGSFVGKSWREK